MQRIVTSFDLAILHLPSRVDNELGGIIHNVEVHSLELRACTAKGLHQLVTSLEPSGMELAAPLQPSALSHAHSDALHLKLVLGRVYCFSHENATHPFVSF